MLCMNMNIDWVRWDAAIELTQEEIEVVHVEYIEISSLPMINTDLEVDGTYPLEVEEFRRKVLEADSCLFASPDYNYSITRKLHHFAFIFIYEFN